MTFSLPGCIAVLVLVILAPIAIGFWQGWNGRGAKRRQAVSLETAKPSPAPTSNSQSARAVSSDHLLSGVVLGVALVIATYVGGLVALGLVVLIGMIRSQPVMSSGHEGDAVILSTLMIGAAVIWVLCTLALGFAGAAAARRGGRSAGYVAAAVVATFMLLPSLALGAYSLLAIFVGIAPTFLAMCTGAFFVTRHSVPTALDAAVAGTTRTAAEGVVSILGLFSGGAESPVAAQFRSAWGVDDIDRAGVPHPGVWQAIDSDRRKVLLLVASPFLFLGAYLLLTAWGSPGAFCGSLPLVIVMSLTILAVVYVGAHRKEREATRPVSVAAVELLSSATRNALAAVQIATGDFGLEVAFFDDPAINAYFTRQDSGSLRISVSKGFTALPGNEQQAGLAMLIGRSRISTGFRSMDPALILSQGAGGKEIGEAGESRPNGELAQQEFAMRQWLDVAKAGDAEALLILKDPEPLLEFLRRLKSANTVVRRAPGPEDSLFEYVAWPLSRESRQGEGGGDAALSIGAERVRYLQAVVGELDVAGASG